MFGLVICVSAIIQKWKTCRTRDLCNLTLYRNGLHVGPRDLCIWHYTEWRHVGTRDLCIWHYKERIHVGTCESVYLPLYKMKNMLGLVICASDIVTEWLPMLGLVICVSDIFTEWTPCWTRDLCIWHYTGWCNVGLVICIWHYTWWTQCWDSWPMYLDIITEWCWTCDLYIWHFTEWHHVGLVICVSDIIQNDVGLVICVSDIITEWIHVGTRDLCIWHLQNDAMLDSWSVYCIMSDTQITSPTWSHSV